MIEFACGFLFVIGLVVKQYSFLHMSANSAMNSEPMSNAIDLAMGI